MPCKDEELFWRWMGSVQRAGEGASQSSDGSRDRFHLRGCYTTEDMAENFQAFDTSAAFVQRARTELALPLRHFQQKMLHTSGDLREHWDRINKSLPITDQRVLKNELRSLGVAFDALFPSPWNPQLKGAQGVQKAAQCEATLRQVVLVEAGKGPSPNEPSTINIQEHVYALRERYASASREYTDQLAEASKELRKVLTFLADLQVLTIGKKHPFFDFDLCPSLQQARLLLARPEAWAPRLRGLDLACPVSLPSPRMRCVPAPCRLPCNRGAPDAFDSAWRCRCDVCWLWQLLGPASRAGLASVRVV